VNNDQVVDAYKNNRQILVNEQEALERTIQLLSESRLNNGILFIPESLTAELDLISEEEEEEDADLEAELVEALTSPISDIHVASAFMPFIIRGPEELYSEIRYDAPDIHPDLEVLQNRVEFIKTRIEWLDEHRPDAV
jgi:hypothetical protein